MGGDEIKFVNDAFDTNWIAPLGANVDGFEKDLQEYTGVKHAAALVSGTAAIHLALIMLGVERGDDVICQSMTFSASANPVVYQCANPVFVDSENETWNIDTNLLEDAIKFRVFTGKKPKVIIFVHLYGMPAKIKEIKEIAEKYEIALIEDAAEALGARYNGISVGGFGDIGILSFNGNKIITTSGGGALLSDNEKYVEQAKFLATQARDDAPHYEHSSIGYNYRMSNVVAGIGRGQMKVIVQRVLQKRKIFDFYKKSLSEIEGISFLNEPEGHFSNRWLTTILIDKEKTNGVTREDVRMALEKEDIDSRPLWKPMHLQPVFRDAVKFENGTSEALFRDGLCLPSGTSLSENDLERIVNIIINTIKELSKKHQ
jgi:dTDP-4-amino-4,6-dideoxygalactose transaminase